ncbi:MAG: TetR/AcrR family transcriptional regulator [Alcanivorax sp.]|nr:TetR/AcrR family transcriptional regulator [Alcanivorax sp.]
MEDPRRARILACALDVFADEGFRSAEVRTIAERAGVGKATIYKFFAGKDALLLTLVEENLNRIRDRILTALMGSEPPLQRLETLCRSVSCFLQENQAFSRVLIQEAGDFMGDIQRQYLALMEQNLPVAEAFFAELRNQGYFVALSTRDTVLMMINLLVGTTYTWALTGEGQLEQQAVDYMRVLVRGLRQD